MSTKSVRRTQPPRWVRPLHTYSSMLMLLIMLFFTVTGLTLNNRHWLPSPEPLLTTELRLPGALAERQLWQQEPQLTGMKVWQWLQQETRMAGGELQFDWDPEADLLTLDIKRPGGYSLIEIAPQEGIVRVETQHYGWLAQLNDLHMGRYSGALWSWFIDISAVVMLLFTLTGFWLVLPQRKRRLPLLALSGMGVFIMAALYLWSLY